MNYDAYYKAGSKVKKSAIYIGNYFNTLDLPCCSSTCSTVDV